MSRTTFLALAVLIGIAIYLYTQDRPDFNRLVDDGKSVVQPLLANVQHLPGQSAGINPDLSQAIVVIKGDVGAGTGFLVQTVNGPAVVTNIHVIAGNPNLHIYTKTGAEIAVLSLEGATDRDLAMFLIQDQHYAYLDVEKDVADNVHADDAVVTPGNSEGGDVILDTQGKVKGIGPDKIEISNPVFHGNSGGPVIDVSSGKVVGVVTSGSVVTPSDILDQASLANPASAIVGPVRYFALRLDTVPQWESYDMQTFLYGSTLLRNFHDESRCLDSLMNGVLYEKLHLTDRGFPDSKYFLRDAQLRAMDSDYGGLAPQLDAFQRVEELRVLMLKMNAFADAGVELLNSPGTLYSFERDQVGIELTYRAELKKEISIVGDKLGSRLPSPFQVK